MSNTSRPGHSFLQMIFAPMKLLAHIYLEVLGDDIRKESARCLSAIIMLSVGFFFVFNTILIINALGVFLLNTLFNNWLWSLLVVLGLQFVLAILFVFLAKSALSGPYFSKTRKMLDKAYREFE
ncbi:MAG: phage holin family protein [Oligoflexales bacterium]